MKMGFHRQYLSLGRRARDHLFGVSHDPSNPHQQHSTSSNCNGQKSSSKRMPPLSMLISQGVNISNSEYHFPSQSYVNHLPLLLLLHEKQPQWTKKYWLCLLWHNNWSSHSLSRNNVTPLLRHHVIFAVTRLHSQTAFNRRRFATNEWRERQENWRKKEAEYLISEREGKKEMNKSSASLSRPPTSL